MASQAAFFGSSPPPPIKKANTASSTTTETSNSKTKNGIKTIATKYVTTTRTPTDLPDQNTNTINQEKREYNDGTTDDITLTRKVLGGMQYDIETIIRVTTKDVGKKNTKTTYATPYQQLDPVTGKPINAFTPATHKGPEHAKTPEGLAAQIGAKAPKVSGLAHNVVPTTTRGGVPTASGPTISTAGPAAKRSPPAVSGSAAPVLSPAPSVVGSSSAPGNGKNYLNSGGTHRIDTTNVSVNMTNTVVHKQAPKKTFVPAFAQQKLKSPNSPTRTFRGGTQVVTTKAMPNISKSNAAPTTTTPNSPKRLAQPHDKAQVAPAPVAYVPEDRLYKKKVDDHGWKQNSTTAKQPTSAAQNTVTKQPTSKTQNTTTKQTTPTKVTTITKQTTPTKQTATTTTKQTASTKKTTVTKQPTSTPRPKSPPRISVEQRNDDDEISC